MKPDTRILVVDDEEVACESLAAWLREDGYAVDTALSGRRAIECARERRYAICFVDLKMPGLDGIGTLKELRAVDPEAAVIIITAFATIDTAIAAIRQGAQEYLVKPCSPAEISLLVARIMKLRRLERENTVLRKRLERRYRFQDIVFKSSKMQAILELARQVAGLPSTVLLRGDSGTGKGLIARAIHNSGVRAPQPFVSVSCAALAETLLESELFGYEKGSFTGAAVQQKGKFEVADSGTIFLDEIGDISPKLQSDLLRVLEERRFYRVGGTTEVEVDARIIAATHRDLAAEVREGRFRDDLFYRLNVIEICIPPLRERREDIPLLARHFVERLSLELGKHASGLSEGALQVLLEAEWPGNVRELENAIERALVVARTEVLTEEDFAFLSHGGGGRLWTPPVNLTLQEIEHRAIVAALEHHAGNIKEAAAALGIDRSTLYDKIRRYNISR